MHCFMGLYDYFPGKNNGPITLFCHGYKKSLPFYGLFCCYHKTHLIFFAVVFVITTTVASVVFLTGKTKDDLL